MSIKDITDPAKQMAENIKIIKITLDVQLDINYLESFLQTETPSTSSLVCTNVEATPTAANAYSQQAQPLSNSSLNSNKALPSKMSFVKTNLIGSKPGLHKTVSTKKKGNKTSNFVKSTTLVLEATGAASQTQVASVLLEGGNVSKIQNKYVASQFIKKQNTKRQSGS